MSEFQIRLYKDSDYERVREIFADGIKEHTGKAFQISLCLPRIWIFLLLSFLLVLQTTGSLMMSFLVVIVDIGLLYLINKYVYMSYVRHCLSDDMLDISKYYLQRDGYCFWVAESAGEVAGMVAAIPRMMESAGEIAGMVAAAPSHHVELKRMSVPKKYRGKGIAKALCRTVIDFARKRGCKSVILETTNPQIDAWVMYEKMGFKRMRTITARTLLIRLIGLKIFFYQYNLPIHQ